MSGGVRGARSGPARSALAVVLAALVLAVTGGLALALGVSMLFPSLGPTLFVQVESPTLPAARPWNVVAGHAIGAAAGYLAACVTGAVAAPSVLATAQVTAPRVAAAVVAVALTLALGSLLRASHPPAAATTLLVALGGFVAMPAGPVALAAGVLVVAVLGEAARRAVLPADAPREARSLGLPVGAGRTTPPASGQVPGSNR